MRMAEKGQVLRETEKKKESSRTDLGMGVWCGVKDKGKEVEF